MCCAAGGKNVFIFTLRSQTSWQSTRAESFAAQQGRPDASVQGTKASAARAGGAVSDLYVDLDNSLQDAQELFKAAGRIVMESCGEKWLLQPFIPDMEINEYRCVHAFQHRAIHAAQNIHTS